MESLDIFLNHNPYVEKLKKHLSKKRYEHTIRVVHTAVHLAQCHNINAKKAAIASLLHDCAKNLPMKKQEHVCEKHKISISPIEMKNPDLLHAKVGSYLAMEEYHIKDKDILNAIRYHTTGRPNMSLLEKVVYISDYIEPHRNHEGRLDKIRLIADQDLDKAMYMILEDTLSYLEHKSKAKDPLTHETLLFYEELIHKNEV